MSTHNLPLISVLIPTRDRPYEFEKALNSVLIQDYKNIEIIISDNSINYRGYARELYEKSKKNSNIVFYEQSRDIQAHEHFDFLIKKSTGKYLMFLADDDWISDETYIRKCTEFLVLHNDFVICCGTIKYYREQKNILSVAHSFEEESSFFRCIKTWNVNNMSVFYGVMRRDILDKVTLKNHLAGDRTFIATMAYCGKIKSLECVVYNRVLDKSTSNSTACLLNQFGIKYRGVFHFRLLVAISAFKGVFFRKNVYGNLLTRCSIGLCCFLVSAWCSFRLYWLNEKIAHLKYRLKKIINTKK